MPWTDEKMEQLRGLWEGGLTASAIADAMGDGFSRNAIIGKAHRLGLAGRPSPVKPGEETVVRAKPAGGGKPGGGGKAAPKPQRTSLLELSDKVCKWPIGHPGEIDFHFCGKPSSTGFPYCGEHCTVAYQAQQPRRDRPSRPLPPVRVR